MKCDCEASPWARPEEWKPERFQREFDKWASDESLQTRGPYLTPRNSREMGRSRAAGGDTQSRGDSGT